MTNAGQKNYYSRGGELVRLMPHPQVLSELIPEAAAADKHSEERLVKADHYKGRWGDWANSASWQVGSHKLAWPRTENVLASICHAITDPPVTKIRLWASFGV